VCCGLSCFPTSTGPASALSLVVSRWEVSTAETTHYEEIVSSVSGTDWCPPLQKELHDSYCRRLIVQNFMRWERGKEKEL